MGGCAGGGFASDRRFGGGAVLLAKGTGMSGVKPDPQDR